MKACRFEKLMGLCLMLPLCLIFGAAFVWGQQFHSELQKEDAQENAANEAFKIKVTTEEVRLDVVVLRKNWKAVSDLTADNFEIYQDNIPQKVLACVYIANQNSRPTQSSLPRTKGFRNAPQMDSVLDRENVNRVFLFIVDDLSNVNFAQMALRRFVERQMRPGDLVGILQTSRGNSALNVFSSDKRELLARIERLVWRPHAQNEGFGIYEGQISMLGYGIRALKDMPGRKAMILLTPQPNIRKDLYMTADEMFAGKDIDYKYMFGKAYDRLADQALRARVVIHVMDTNGLWAPDMSIPRELLKGPDLDLASIGQAPYREFDRKKTDPWNPLPLKTGGTIVTDANFFLDGIGEKVGNMMDGYYLLSYMPPDGTFAKDKRYVYHKIKVRVKLHGMEVYARDGFYGRNEEDAAPRNINPLQEAIFSPFLNKALNVNLTSGYLDDAKNGYVLRSWMHVSAGDITIKEKPGQGYFASLETVCLTSDIEGHVQDARMMRYDFKISEENLPWVLAEGLRFSMLLPVKSPGPYYIRAAVKDIDSGKIGSAYQFVQIPDLKKKRPALSNIFIVNREEEAMWIKTGIAGDLTRNVIQADVRREACRSSAMRRYVAGDDINYMTVLYNANREKEKPPNFEVQSILYKDGSEVYKSEFSPLELNGVTNSRRIPIIQKLTLDPKFSKGNYVLEMLVHNKDSKKKDSFISQSLDFQIVAD
jgi:VWFA-related protein